MMIRRVVTGLTPDRKARIASDTEVDGITDLTLGLYALPIFPLRSTAGSVVAPQCPSIGNHAVNESDRGPCRNLVEFPRPSTRHFSTRPSHLLITRVFPDARLL